MRTKSTNGASATLHPVADTVAGNKAAEAPDSTIAHYDKLAERLWLPPALTTFADRHLQHISEGRTAWGSVAAPYGFGKTATAVCLWHHARRSGFLAIPPLSCTGFDELAAAIDALAEAQIPALKKDLRRLRADLWREELDEMARSDSDRYGLPQATVRRLLRDKAQAGCLAFDGSSHRFVEFLSRLGELAARHCKGLVVIVDELQQLLGPLDARTVNRFREFVWGMRTERSRCGVVLALDTLLEARLARWAEDILHRIRESGPTFQLAEVYTREFPTWLWGKLTTRNGSGRPHINGRALSRDVLLSLGQLVERSDLANGPRTVVDVFQRASEHFASTRSSYEINHLIEDVRDGRFRYFGEGYPIQIALGRLLADEWIAGDDCRRSVITTLAAFPLGCPDEVLERSVPDRNALDKTVGELFAPLLVKLSGGLALEALQQVRRPVTNWEQIIRQCWERLPALDTLVAHAPQFILRTLIPRLFARGNPADPQWELISDEAVPALTGWRRYRGSFDPAFPSREVAVYIGQADPSCWPEDADLSFALICETSTLETAKPSVSVLTGRRALLRLPILRALEAAVPAELDRYRKFIQPEPFRPAMILTALHDLQSITDPEQDLAALTPHSENAASVRQMVAFVEVASDFLVHELIEGSIDVGRTRPVTLRGPDLLRALFSTAFRRDFPHYQTLKRGPKWRDMLKLYRDAVGFAPLTLAQRQGRDEIRQPKADVYSALFRQNSTATGDSLIRALGPLVKTSGDSQAFALRLPLHPGESALLQYLRKSPRRHVLPVSSAAEFLRHRGYVADEASELIEILAARQAITIDRHRGITLLEGDSDSRDWLSQRVSILEQELAALGTDVPPAPCESTCKDLRQHVAALEEHLRKRVEELASEVQGGVDELANLIGTVVASKVPEEWLTSDLSTQLRGVGVLLLRSQGDLLRALRKELKRAQDELDRIGDQTTAAAVAWYSRREGFRAGWERLRQRTTQIRDRIHALSAWAAPNSQLHATRALCLKLRPTDRGPAQLLDQLVAEFRERFAVDQWAPLFAAAEFTERLRVVQAEVQTLLFRHVQTFYRERALLLRDLGHLLGQSAPEFDVESEGGDNLEAINRSFQQLYRWAAEKFQASLDKSRERYRARIPWRDPRSARRSWKELNAKADALLDGMAHGGDYKKTLAIGAVVDRIRAGFRLTKAPQICYENREQPPDFDELAELFANGLISIRIEPKQ